MTQIRTIVPYGTSGDRPGLVSHVYFVLHSLWFRLMNDPTSASQKTPLVTEGVLPDEGQIPIIAEELHIGTQVVETGRVQITKTIQHEEQTVRIPLISDEFDIERVTLNQYVDQPPATRQEGETTIYPVLKEVLVVEKRLLLVEEIRVTRRQSETTQTQTVVLRKENVQIERIDLSPERSAPEEPSL